jgi:hypothetical protein
MKKKNSIFSNNWFIGIVTGLIVLLVDRIFGIIHWTKIFDWSWNLLFGEIKTNLFVLLLIFLFGIFLRRISNSIKNMFKDDSPTSIQTTTLTDEPGFLKYTEDTFNNMLYRWTWVGNNSGQNVVRNIWAFCPKCKCRLVGDSCPNCNESYYGLIQSTAQVEALIHHKLDVGSSNSNIANS